MTEQILTLAALLEAIVLMPILIEFLSERQKRRHTVALGLEVIEVAGLNTQLAGLDEILGDIKELIDRARHPDAYADLKLGNEILIVGPPLSGKKALAKRIAKEANFDHIIIIHNPRNRDVLARAKALAQKTRNHKVMLLLPRLDLIDEREDEEILVEIDALIEATSELSHALVVGTTNKLVCGSEIDNLFGVALPLPGAPVVPLPHVPLSPETHRMMAAVADFYVDRALEAGYELSDISRDGLIARLLISVTNPAQLEDTIVLCQTSAICRQRTGKTKNKQITPEIVELAMRLVILADSVPRKI